MVVMWQLYAVLQSGCCHDFALLFICNHRNGAVLVLPAQELLQVCALILYIYLFLYHLFFFLLLFFNFLDAISHMFLFYCAEAPFSVHFALSRLVQTEPSWAESSVQFSSVEIKDGMWWDRTGQDEMRWADINTFSLVQERHYAVSVVQTR